MRHIWFVLSISVYWEESSRGWGGNALCEIFCNVSESTVYNENNGLGKTATRRQSTRALEPLMWKLVLGFFTCFTSLPSEGKAHVNALPLRNSWRLKIRLGPLCSGGLQQCKESPMEVLRPGLTPHPLGKTSGHLAIKTHLFGLCQCACQKTQNCLFASLGSSLRKQI